MIPFMSSFGEQSARPRQRITLEKLQWILIGALAAVSGALGYIGFLKHSLAYGPERTVSDIIYLTLQLFAIESGSLPGTLPVELDAARFLAPVATAGAVLKTMAVVFRDRLRLFRVGRMRDHTVVCGLGRKGTQFVADFSRVDSGIVAIERDSENDNVRTCDALGVPVLIGDATDITLLRRAGVDRARHIVSTCGDDGLNVDVAILAYGLAARRRSDAEPLRCSVQIADLRLSQLLEEHGILTRLEDRFEASIFNVYQLSARRLLHDHPLDYVGITPDDPRVPHLVIVGFGQMGESIAVQAAKIGCFANGCKLRLDVIDRVAEARKEKFRGEHPAVDRLTDMTFIEGDAHDPGMLDRIRAWSEDEDTITSVAVCLDDDPRALSCALAILSRLEQRSTPLLVRMADSIGLATLLESEGEHSAWTRHVHAFGMVDTMCTREALLHEEQDKLARAIHEDYVRRARARGRSDSDRAMRPWSRLDESLRNSNRQSADHIPVKLRAIGCASSAEPLDAPEVEEFTEEEIELLSRMEHARWCSERILQGWSDGPRDHEHRTTPYLVGFDDLPEEIKDYDRDAVRAIPGYLKAVGKKIYRVG
ncbi:MAG: hypothetical protein GF400_10900 [Candidatus Eisenbacteria bacterium]|nr:hypothetical protein [Candidatus Eisenbacteria bacterium]